MYIRLQQKQKKQQTTRQHAQHNEKTKFDFHYDYVILKIPACLYECMDFVLWFNYQI